MELHYVSLVFLCSLVEIHRQWSGALMSIISYRTNDMIFVFYSKAQLQLGGVMGSSTKL